MRKISLFALVFGISMFALTAICATPVKVGADQLQTLIPRLQNKSVALVVNHTSCLTDGTHLLDALLANNIKVTKIFAPEHGFRGNEDAGAKIINEKDKKTGLPVISLYGRSAKPSSAMLQDVDEVIFDIQDVGARFYTYISTMHYIMESCAENNKKLIILDRPNPHDFIDGPVLEARYKSFVGMHPIPVLHGLTVGELAQMINGEGWLKNGNKCNLDVVAVVGWKHGDPYSLPIKPSPNLPNDQSIRMYTSLCFFEATNVSVGRGTYFPFQVVGYPNPKFGTFKFTPESLRGSDTNPLQKGKVCYGIDLRQENLENGFTLSYLLSFYKKMGTGAKFFKSPQFMNLLAGNNKLQQQIISGMKEEAIRKTWKKDLDNYKEKRKKYILYTDKMYN